VRKIKGELTKTSTAVLELTKTSTAVLKES
jgi:hypothetical protein